MSVHKRKHGNSEVEYLERKWDKCMTSSIKYIGLSTLAGFLVSVFIFRRKRWPIIAGLGHGLGMSYALCDRIFRRKDHIPLPVCPSTVSKKPQRRNKQKIKGEDKMTLEAIESKILTPTTKPPKQET